MRCRVKKTMPRAYRKPPARGGSRIIPRDRKGRFARGSLNCEICLRCGQIIPLRSVNVGTEQFPMLRTVYPDLCPTCSRKLK